MLRTVFSAGLFYYFLTRAFQDNACVTCRHVDILHHDIAATNFSDNEIDIKSWKNKEAESWKLSFTYFSIVLYILIYFFRYFPIVSVQIESSRVKCQSLPTSAQLDSILHLNGKVNLNLKQISELISERGRLTFKVHEASIGRVGSRSASPEYQPHLSVSEMALTKRLATLQECSAEDRRLLRELRDTAALLDAYSKWLDKRHVFFDWMVMDRVERRTTYGEIYATITRWLALQAAVVREHRRSMECGAIEIDLRELAVCVSLLRRVLGDELRAQESEETTREPRDLSSNCPSRAQRCNDTEETQRWLDDLNECQKVEEDSLRRNRDRLAEELKGMLRRIPSTVCIWSILLPPFKKKTQVWDAYNNILKNFLIDYFTFREGSYVSEWEDEFATFWTMQIFTMCIMARQHRR